MYEYLSLYLHSVRYLTPIQVANRIWRTVTRVSVPNGPAPRLDCSSTMAGSGFLARPASILPDYRFRFLNRAKALTLPQGWVDHGETRLWGYHLHYFDGLSDPATPATRKLALVEAWIAGNPLRSGPGWEPYPLSLRIVNWLKWAMTEGACPEPVAQSLGTQVRFLDKSLEYHLLGNHLLANAKALVFAGLMFEGHEAERWYRRGMSIFKRQLPEQFLADGGHFELSPVYHALLTEDLLDLVNVHRLRDERAPELFITTARDALRWLAVMTRPDGLPPLFNDAAYGVAPTLTELISFGQELELGVTPEVSEGITRLEASGYIRYEGERYSVFLDVGQVGPSYIPGHAHCDMLSFELSVGDRPVIVDTGTSTYEVGDRRTIERGTAAHNTVQVGDREQSEIWAAFRMGRRASIEDVAVDGHVARATCRGFPPARIRHAREVRFGRSGIVIVDELHDEFTRDQATARFHLAPGEEPTVVGADAIRSASLTLRFMGASAIRISDYQYAPGFNTLIAARVIEADFSVRLVTEISL